MDSFQGTSRAARKRARQAAYKDFESEHKIIEFDCASLEEENLLARAELVLDRDIGVYNRDYNSRVWRFARAYGKYILKYEDYDNCLISVEPDRPQWTYNEPEPKLEVIETMLATHPSFQHLSRCREAVQKERLTINNVIGRDCFIQKSRDDHPHRLFIPREWYSRVEAIKHGGISLRDRENLHEERVPRALSPADSEGAH
jgi:hypothetical protein